MRTVPRVRVNQLSAPTVIVAALLFSASFCFPPIAAAFEGDVETPSDVEQPAEVAPDESEAPSPETQPGDILPVPRELNRGVFRPDLQPGSEGAGEPGSPGENGAEGLAAQPDDIPLPSPADKPKVLGELYVRLAKAKDAEEAAPIITNIEALWRVTGSPTVDLLIGRAERFTKDKDLDLALQILDATVAMAPEEAEAWYLRAKVQYAEAKYDLALADLNRALERDPKHYRALEQLGLAYEALGKKPEALETYRKALAINPFLDDAGQAVRFLEKEIGARNL
jgi:predicted negative regulator of RcsB-dependent stress response